jgi:hypothetical protein
VAARELVRLEDIAARVIATEEADMLDKIKDLRAQVASKAGVAMDDLASSVKVGAESLASTASSVTGSLNEKAVRASTSQMCSLLEIAMQELNGRELSRRPVTLTASVTVGIASLQMQVHLDAHPGTDLLVPPKPSPAEPTPPALVPPSV